MVEVEVVVKVNDDDDEVAAGLLGREKDDANASRMKRLASLSLSLSASLLPPCFGGGQKPTAPQASSASNDSSAAMALGMYSLAISLHFRASSLGSMPHAVSSANRITCACVSGSARACCALVQAQRQTSQAGLASGSSRARGDSVVDDGIGILLSSSPSKTPTTPSGMPFLPPRASAKEGSTSASARARATAARRRATAEERAIS